MKESWTKEDEKFLINNFKKMTNKELSIALNRGIRSIEHKVVRMGLKKREVQYFDKDEIGEIWKKIIGTDYSISQYGRVRNDTKGRIMITREGLDGYLKVKLIVNGKQKDFFIHRLVAEYFLEKEEGKNYVNHKDGIKTHSYLSNLEWCTAKENVEHAHNMYKKRILYTKEQRNTIAEMLKSGIQVQVIAKTAGFFVTNGYVRKIRKELKLEAQRSTTIPKGSRA